VGFPGFQVEINPPQCVGDACPLLETDIQVADVEQVVFGCLSQEIKPLSNFN
jgi:hypothetical protein